MKRILALSLLLILITGCHSAGAPQAGVPGLTEATRKYNQFLSVHLAEFEALNTEAERYKYVQDITPALSPAVAEWQKSYEAESTSGTIARTVATEEYSREYARMRVLAVRFAKELKPYEKK